MAILTLGDFMGMIKPHYNEQAQIFLALTELNDDEVQLDDIEDVYEFKNGAVIAQVLKGQDPMFKVVEKDLGTFNQYTLGAYTKYNLTNIDLDVFPHE